MAGYILRWFTHPQTVTHPRTNRVQRGVISLITTNALTTTPPLPIWSVLKVWVDGHGRRPGRDFKAKMHQIRFPLGLRPRLRWGSLQRSPDPLAVFKGPTSKKREGKGRRGEQRGEEEGRVGKVKGEEGCPHWEV